MPAISMKLEKFMEGLKKISSQEEKIVKSLQGFFSFFPFTRISLFSYSPITYMSEGLFFLNSNGAIAPAEEIREDVRNIPPVYTAIHNKKASHVIVNLNEPSFPMEYIEKYKLTSLLIVPLGRGPTVTGCVLIDGFTGKEASEESMLGSIEEYFRLVFHAITSTDKLQGAFKLSNREIEVLEHLSKGWSTKEMAGLMGISEFTARDYISAAMKKMGVKHRAQAIAEAVRAGLIS